RALQRKATLMAVVAQATPFARAARFEQSPAASDPPLIKWIVIGISLVFFTSFLLMPLLAVFAEALKKGWELYLRAITERDALSLVRLSLLAAAIAVPLNVVFGLAASWAIAKHDFRGKQFLITLIDLPFSVSPVIAGLIYVLVFGAQGWFGWWLA